MTLQMSDWEEEKEGKRTEKEKMQADHEVGKKRRIGLQAEKKFEGERELVEARTQAITDTCLPQWTKKELSIET